MNNLTDNSLNNEQEENRYLIFLLNQNLYGFNINNVTEILEYTQPTKVPKSPDYIHGLLNLRGKILPVIDFNLYLSQKDTTLSKKTCIVIVNYLVKGQLNNVGILVDDVFDVVEIQKQMLEHTPEFGVKIKSEFIKNMLILNGKIIVLLDLNKVFSSVSIPNE